MFRYVVKRLLVMLPILLGVTIIIFTMMYFTEGDPARMILGDEASEEEVQELRIELGLTGTYFERYWDYLSGLLQGDLGTSFTTRQPVVDEIAARFPVTLRVTILVCIFSVCIGVPAGIISAIRQYSVLDNVVTVAAMLGICMPNFWLALLLILLFSVALAWLPASGLYGWTSYIMPVLSISAATVATITRMTRSSMLEVIRQDYIRTARAKGQKESIVIMRHALKNALIPIITVVGFQFAVGMGGAVVNEQIFAIPGIGKMMVDAIRQRNYPLVQGGVLVIALAYSLLNLIIDLIYGFVDPRIKTQYARPKKQKKDQQKVLPGKEA